MTDSAAQQPPKPPKLTGVAARVWRAYLMPYRWQMVFAGLSAVLVAGTTGAISYILKPAIDQLFGPHPPPFAWIYFPVTIVVLAIGRAFGGVFQVWLTNTIGNPLETTIALSHLIFEGTFDRFPKLKVIAAHGGGYLGSYADRSDHPCLVGPKGCNPDIKLKKAPTEYLKQIYFDSLIFTPEAIRHLVAQVGAGQVVLGSDYPYPWQMHPVDHIFASTSLSDDQKADIIGRTASKLFNFEI